MPRRLGSALSAAVAAAAVVLLLAAAVPLAGAARAQGKGAKITLQAKWEGTPFLHEAAEFLADEDPALFWEFIDEWQEGLPGLGTSPQQCWAGIRAAAGARLSPAMARLLDVSLAARQYSARLQAFHQLAEDSAAELAAAAGAGSRPCCWALLNGQAYTEAGQLREAVHAALAAEAHEAGGGAGAVYPFDHVYASPAAPAAPHLNITAPGTVPVELFAPIGSLCGSQLHEVLAAAAARSDAAAAAAAAAGAPPPRRLAYARRPLFDAAACAGSEVQACTRLGTGERLVLPGYGVELALKNMEYNAQDDKKDAGTDKKQEGGEEEGGEEAAAAEGGADDDGSEDDGVLQLKLKNLGLQAAQRVLNAAAAGPDQDPLAALQELAQDFPRLVRQVNQQKYGKSLRLAVEGLQRYVPAGAQFLLLNGLMLDTRDLSLYDLLDTLRAEVRLYDALSSVGLPPAQVRQAQLLRGSAAGADEPPRLRLPLQDGVLWVNDIEQDEKYEDWPADLNSLLMPMFPGRLPSVRRNVLTAVYLFDPATPAALDIGALARQADLQMWPLRIGLVPVVAQRAAHARGAPGPKSGDAPSTSERMGRLLSLIYRAHGGEALAEFLFELRTGISPAEQQGSGWGELLWERASRLLAEQWEVWGEDEATAEQVLDQATAPGDGTAASLDPAALKLLDAAAELAANSGLAGKCQSGVLVLNGVVSANEGGGSWQGVTMQALQPQLQAVQEDVYMQRLTERSIDLLEDILKLHGSVSRYNPRIMPLDSGAGYIRISGETEEFAARQLSLSGPLLGPNATAAHPGTPDGGGLWVHYFGPEPSLVDDDDEGQGGQSGQQLAAVTHWVVADVGSRSGLRLVAAALQHRSSQGRVGLLVNAAGAAAPGVPLAQQQLLPIERVLVAVSAGLFDTDRSDFVEQLDTILQRPELPSELTLEQLDDALGWDGRLAAALDGFAGQLPAAAASQARFVRSALDLPRHANAVVTNGRVVELPGDASSARADASSAGAELEPADFELLELYAQRNQFCREVAQLVGRASQAGVLAGADLSSTAAAVSSALAASKPADVDSRSGRVADIITSFSTQRNFLRLPSLAADGGAEHRHGGPAEAPLLVQAILNPLSKPAQRLAPLLRFLRAALGTETHLLLNPQREYEDMPLKTFYRYVLPALPAGDGPPTAATAEFSRLPGSKVLTLGMDEPEAWLVEPVQAQHDLDNLRLEELPAGQPAMEALYELEALMLTGMCLDLASLQARLRDQIHPRGVQLQLLPLSAPPTAPPLVDTLVMSNLGYFQLKSRPGLWKLKLAPGRSQQLYTIASSTGASTSGQRAEAAVSGADAHQVPVALTSFTGKHMHLFLRKHPARLYEDVLEAGAAGDGGDKGSLWSKVSSWAGKAEAGSEPAVPADAEDGRIHVFTVASGHMYERLQKIMVLSATKRTTARVKFWFIKNYMSPQMKAFVPYMARKYDFDYEFVTYKWPSWLHKQTEKQRIIWAYKILFLDVLFPLGLKKVIFCDSDQVVRADLLELWNMDLHGAPYGYTPFCDNNREMEGFRFWKQGFWKDHLQGKPYHISALYVVDLERFRQMAAGDRLRVIYDGLSKDPNSLANLDQDLPNYAQHGVPIFSLPNEWLWCETWCGNETRPQAKTIDLCNNPLTKEPKLQSARRIIAEWPDLDREAAEFTAAVDRVQRGEWTEEQLMADSSAFHVRLLPMVEGSAWTSERGSAAEAQEAPRQAKPGATVQAGGDGAAHDATEL